MSHVHEITVPTTKPATEWVNGRALQKMSPQERHARAQAAMVTLIRTWAAERSAGRVGTEWEFRVTPPHEPTRPLDVAIEVRSPDDRQDDIDHKIRVYLAAGASLVILVDPLKETLSAYDSKGEHRYTSDDVFTHGVLPGFSLEVGSIFRKPKRPV
jgi:Uma2 family endonuclease